MVSYSIIFDGIDLHFYAKVQNISRTKQYTIYGLSFFKDGMTAGSFRCVKIIMLHPFTQQNVP